MKTDLMFTRGVGCESEPPFRAILPSQDDLERRGIRVLQWAWSWMVLKALSDPKVDKQSLR